MKKFLPLFTLFFFISCSVINSSLSKTILKYFSLSNSVSSKPGDNGIKIKPFSLPYTFNGFFVLIIFIPWF